MPRRACTNHSSTNTFYCRERIETSDMAEHLETCEFHKCPYSLAPGAGLTHYGCHKVGTRAQIKQHRKTCSFKFLRDKRTRRGCQVHSLVTDGLVYYL